jgi:hypothetical protein
MDLRCRKTICKYNNNLTCTAKKIDISQKRDCKMFEKDKGKEEIDFSNAIFSDNQPKIADYKHMKDMCLNCQARCLFNHEGRCVSNGITVNGATTKEPKCITFMKP